MTINEEIELYKGFLEKLEKITIIDGIKRTRIEEWDDEKGNVHFPLHIDAEFKTKDIFFKKEIGDMSISLNLDYTRSRIEYLEIISIDTHKNHLLEGYGRMLLEQAIIIAKEFNVPIRGIYLDENAKEFYRHCSFTI